MIQRLSQQYLSIWCVSKPDLGEGSASPPLKESEPSRHQTSQYGVQREQFVDFSAAFLPGDRDHAWYENVEDAGDGVDCSGSDGAAAAPVGACSGTAAQSAPEGQRTTAEVRTARGPHGQADGGAVADRRCCQTASRTEPLRRVKN